MVTVHNVVAASATVGLVGQEGALIRKTVIPMAYYCLVAGLVADALGDAGMNGGGGQVVNACDYGHRAGTATRSGLPAEARAAPKVDSGRSRPYCTVRRR
jgi:lactate permease